ncbi:MULTISPECIES: inositol monophosphatase family protein [unclassified Dietzia]|uniref:inositol monophosphatase family protein n=1 Tax=unclassified Dietzia TaxID=2617939 RepID=UPI0015FCC5DA|nr:MULTISPECIES: inositol monophosphatase [unclassified Dietzia]MBB1024635.1 inositol monophosphatase [Dietzia sp. DQ12-76]MBB1029222.1 inositol monophosphatase [Dietzia sp. DQ11-38-2]
MPPETRHRRHPSDESVTAIADEDLAARLVVDAGTLARRLRDDGLDVHHKTSVSDVVTEADRAAEHQITTLLAAHRPEDGVLGEEGTLVQGRHERRWVVDPVDGTYNFVSGSDYWCSAVAVTGPDDYLLGAVHRPVTGETFVGGSDVPTRRNGVPVTRLTPGALAAGSLATYLHPPFFADPDLADPFHRVSRGAATIRMLGSGSVDLAAVACGVHSVWCQHSCPEWDWLPGRALVEGAGGLCATVEVNGYDWFVAGRPGAVEDAVALLRG